MSATKPNPHHSTTLPAPRALPHLNELLPADLADLSTLAAGYGAGVLDDVVLYNGSTQTIIDRYGGGEKGTPGWVMRPWRPRLRSFLWNHLNVQTNKSFSHYTEDLSSGTITAHFQDGKTSTGTLLVGADGSRSKVRTHMLGPEASKLSPADFQAIMLDVKLTKAQYADFCQISTSTIVIMGKGVWATAAIRETFPDGSAYAFLSVAWKTDDPPADSAWLNAASKASRYRKATELLAKGEFPRWVNELFEQAGVEGIGEYPVLLNEFVPPKGLPRGSATLVGDALHCMTPFKGAGANTAIRDAADLGRALVRQRKSGVALDRVLREYEEVAVPRGREQVLASRAAAFSVLDGSDWRGTLMKGRHSTKETEEVGNVEVSAAA